MKILSTTLAAAALVTVAGAAAVPADAAAGRTALTVSIADCEGCTVQLQQAVPRGDGVRVWSSAKATVTGGEAVLDVPSRRTWGSVMTLTAPWEGQLGYVTTVAVRYADHAVGEPVSVTEAAGERRATGCWAGTRRHSLTLEVDVEQTTVRGVSGSVVGTRAWTPETQDWQGATRRTPGGVLGSQDVDVCR
jgi:hypothetical protein